MGAFEAGGGDISAFAFSLMNLCKVSWIRGGSLTGVRMVQSMVRGICQSSLCLQHVPTPGLMMSHPQILIPLLSAHQQPPPPHTQQYQVQTHS
ncbi:hypothetical protein XELAEV_18038207mg [Xenopus laevis]|uniref:Uncharacterized protein n=1 Tax=Xenopus laevis TaxID=8355 RepID=A0A974C599_XENLA|nr:hypothetical protein XELAEV_18038207mg [Xenopus laevis]